jgi:hypothetical protein
MSHFIAYFDATSLPPKVYHPDIVVELRNNQGRLPFGVPALVAEGARLLVPILSPKTREKGGAVARKL